MSPDNKDADSLEGTDTSAIETESLATPDDGVRPAPDQQTPPPRKHGGLRAAVKRFRHRFNIYLLLFVLVLVASAGVLVVTIFSQHTSKPTATISSQSIPIDTLKQLAKTDTNVGNSQQVLNVQSDAVFAGKVLVQGNLDVAGAIHVNGSLSLPGINVSGNSTLDQVQINQNLSVGGDTSVLGQLSVKKNLSVSGNGTFGGTLTAATVAANQLQLVGNLTLINHIVAGGLTPTRSSGSALGSGGTASVSGSDTAGSININTGNSPAAGCFLSVSFTSKYDNTPHIVLSPTSSAASTVSYYTTKTTTGFNICTTSTPPANSSLSFDYIVLG